MKPQKLPSGNYRVRVYIGKDENGKDILKSFTDKDKDAAVAKAMAYKTKNKTKNKKKPRTFSQVEEMTVGKAIDNYIAE